MPFIDFNRESDSPAITTEPALVIIGAGAAGILLATRLAAQGRHVLLVESGHFSPDDQRQALNDIEQTGKPLSNAIWNRKRILGGTTTAWGGQSLPFSPLDFARRDWVPGSGWPIPYDEVAAYYVKANAFMGIDGWNYDTDLFGRLHRTPPPFAAETLRFHFSKWAPQPDFLKLRRHELERQTTVLYNAHLIGIEFHPDNSGRVSHVTLANFAGGSRRVPVDTLILAAGGIETIRLLLLHGRPGSSGIGNHSGWLGRGFMDHPSIDAGSIEPIHPRAFQRTFGTCFHRRHRYSLRLSATEDWQRRHALLNASATFFFAYETAADDPFATVRECLRRPSIRAITRTVRHLPRLTRAALALISSGFVYKPSSCVRLALMAEQEPTVASFITLDATTDGFGLHKARLHWRITEKTWQTTVRFAREIESEIARLGIGRVRLSDQLHLDNPDWETLLTDVNHHMGGARMSATAEEGVVDPHLRVWGVPNLFVASSAVFPTSSHSNPTLTLLALCERLADHLENTTRPTAN